MKHVKTITRSAAAAMALCGLAQAETVPAGAQLYGRLDVSINQQQFSRTSGQADRSVTLMSSDTSYFGFRGTEDLGGGTRAYFKLESGLNIDTGAQASSTVLFNRETYVGIASNNYGALQIGSQFSPTQWLTKKADPFERSNTGALLTLFQESGSNSFGYLAQFNNAVQYISPDLGGFVGRLFWAAGEGSNLGSAYSVGGEYTGDRLWIGSTAARARTTGALVGLAAPTALDQSVAVGATYRLDSVKLHAFLLNNKIDGGTRMKGYMAGLSIPFGRGEIRTSYSHRGRADVGNADAALVALNYSYFLSKRTTLYASTARLTNQPAAQFGVWPASREAAALGFPAAGQDVTSVQIGMRHLF